MKKNNKKCAVCSSNFVQKWVPKMEVNDIDAVIVGFVLFKKNETIKHQNSFVWFKKWVLERQVYKYLVRDSKRSR